MASLKNATAGIPTVTRPLESSSWSFTDSKPSMMIKYDAKHTHVWTIGEFSKKMQMENGRRLKSDKFSIKVGDKIVDWYVEIFPNGEMNASIGHISAHLLRASKTQYSIDVKYIFSIVDLEGFKSNNKTVEKTIIEPEGYEYGSKKWSHSNLKNLISNDTITIMWLLI